MKDKNVGRVTVSAAAYQKLAELSALLRVFGKRQSIVSIIAEIVEDNLDHVQERIDGLKQIITQLEKSEE